MTPALPGELRSGAAHVFVDSLDAAVLDGADAHHLHRVLRLRNGDTLTVSDGRGSWAVARLCGNELDVDGTTRRQIARGRVVTIAAAVPKGGRLDWMVHKLTEVGVGRIVLLECARSVVRWDSARAGRQLDRLRRIAREASMQSRRVWLPEVTGPMPLADLRSDPHLVFADPDGAPFEPAPEDVAVAIGPEGGFTDAELAGSTRVALSGQVLRVETAALAAAVLSWR